ncbi:Atu4866 domain-containing protein [Nonomuraea sp. NPDC049158]|uniref:Atu4866 domain-containing protein n=1 Tax=Nonomuraea sp. NPDC049158 TaxID=3155649 RepID=UPI0034029555
MSPTRTTSLTPPPANGSSIIRGTLRHHRVPLPGWRAPRNSAAYTGRYTVTGAHLDYVDDTGFTATGDIRDGVLSHEHLVLYRKA